MARTQKTALYGAIESTRGTAVALSKNHLVRAYQCEINPIIEQSEIPEMRDHMGAPIPITTGLSYEATFKVMMNGAGTAGALPAFDGLLQGCGLMASVVSNASSQAIAVDYKPISDNFRTLTMLTAVDGVKYQLTQSMGNVKFDLSAGQVPTMEFAFKGAYSDPSLSAPPQSGTAPNYLNAEANRPENWVSATIDGTSINFSKLTLDLGQSVDKIPIANQFALDITKRATKGNLEILHDGSFTNGLFIKATNSDSCTMNFIFGQSAGRITQFRGNKVILTNPKKTDIAGLVGLSFDLTLLPIVGNDEIIITLK